MSNRTALVDDAGSDLGRGAESRLPALADQRVMEDSALITPLQLDISGPALFHELLERRGGLVNDAAIAFAGSALTLSGADWHRGFGVLCSARSRSPGRAARGQRLHTFPRRSRTVRPAHGAGSVHAPVLTRHVRARDSI